MSGAASPPTREELILNAESTLDGVTKFAASYAAVLAGIDAKAGALVTL